MQIFSHIFAFFLYFYCFSHILAYKTTKNVHFRWSFGKKKGHPVGCPSVASGVLLNIRVRIVGGCFAQGGGMGMGAIVRRAVGEMSVHLEDETCADFLDEAA